MRFLVTGGAGFIGSHLCDELVSRGHEVHVLDDLSTGSMDNIRHLKGQPKFDYTIESAANTPIVAELVDGADVVYHLAAAVGVQLIVESPVRTIETNVHCTEVVLAQASKKRKPVFIASTSEVYGKSPNLPYREDGDLTLGATVRGRWSYACSKAIDEFLALAHWKERGLPTIVGRLFNTVGPRQTGRYGMVIPTFVQQALDGENHCLRGRHAAQMFLSRRRCRLRAGRLDAARQSLRRGVQHRLPRRDHDRRAGAEGA
jgi:UDP-glucose 4-epimerase